MNNLIFIFLLLIPFSGVEAKKPIEAGKELAYGFAAKASFEKDWKLKSFGWKLKEKKILILEVGFKIFEVPSLKTARKNMLVTIEELIDYINSDERNREYFSVFPISEKNLDISISYVDKRGLMIKDNLICSTLMLNSTLFYSHNTEKKLENVHKESYADALKIFQRDSNQKWLKAQSQE